MEDNISQSNVSQQPQKKYPHSEMRGPHLGVSNTGTKTNKTMTHDVIAEEQVEDSAHNTKRASVEVNPKNISIMKSLASASAPNLNQSASTTQVKTVNLVSRLGFT